MEILVSIAVAITVGLLMTRILARFHLPDVTAYLIAGVILGPFVIGRIGIPGLGFVSEDFVSSLSLVSDVALGFIAFSIGSEFRVSALKKIGKQAFMVGTIQAVVATALVDCALVVFHFIRPDIITLPAAITLGAIAAATAPASTMMVVRQYKAKGDITDILLPIVALDDAVGLAVFSVSFGVAKAMETGALSIVSIIVNPLLEIVCSLVLGALAGFILTKLETLFHSNTNRMALTIGFVILTLALAMNEFTFGEIKIGFSSLLVCMMMGTVFCNICPLSEELMGLADRWSAPVMAAFFVLSGASLKLDIFGQVMLVLVGVVYIIFRTLGKYFGAFFSAKAAKCPPKVVKFLGITLLPQEGVALGMCVTAQALADGPFIRNIVLFAVLVYEMVGPIMTKAALTKAGEITEKPREIVERRTRKLEQAPKKELIERAEKRREERKHKK